MNEGFYGTVGYGVQIISLPPDQIIGDPYDGSGSQIAVSNAIGGSNQTSVITSVPIASQMTTGSLESKWVTASEFEVGNQQGHHGWSVKGTILSPQRYSVDGFDAGVVIEDPAVVDVSQFQLATSGANLGNYYVWKGRDSISPDTAYLVQVKGGSSAQIGRLWGIIGLYGSGTSESSYSGGGSSSGNEDSEENLYAFVPMPLTYETFNVKYNTNYYSVEAMYNYRFHPFRRGTLEFLAGVRYSSLEDELQFFGHSTTKTTTEYSDTRIEILQTGTQSSSGGQAVTSTSQDFVSNSEDQTYEVGADLGYSRWTFSAQNHIVGPQFGLRYTVSNNRWRFMNETKFFAGINRQNIRGYGDLGLKPSSTQNTNLTQTNGTPLYAPINTVQNYFNYSSHYTYFTPGVNTKFEAAWNWTRVLSFKFGYELTWLDNIARSCATNDYRMNEDGTIFGVKENKDDRMFGTFIHGAMFTICVNR